MSFYKSLLNRFILPFGDKLFSGNYLKYLDYWKAYDGKSESELEIIQNDALAKILEHSTTHVPFYKQQKLKKLTDFPILTKTVLRNSANELVSGLHDISKLDKHYF